MGMEPRNPRKGLDREHRERARRTRKVPFLLHAFRRIDHILCLPTIVSNEGDHWLVSDIMYME
jgi:hypothetical protein